MIQAALRNEDVLDKQRNGEAWLLRRLSGCLPARIIFDVGANHDDWAALALSWFPESVVFLL